MLVKPMILSFFAWAFEVVTLLLVFASLGQAIPLDKVVIVRAIGGNIEYQGYVFAGYAQIVTTTLYRVLGVQTAMAASVAILGGVVIFWIKTVLSYAAFHYTLFRKHDKNNLVYHVDREVAGEIKESHKQIPTVEPEKPPKS